MSHSLLAQDDFEDNGNNLQAVCPPETCQYMAFTEPIYFPYSEDKEWEIRNMELAIKKGGNFLSTGDLYVYGEDTAVIMKLEMIFFSPEGDKLFSFSVPEIEFYNEKSHAEPIVFSGKLEGTMTELVNYFDVKIKASQRLPYYEISEDCYLPCKEHKLKEAIKAFKKVK